MATPPVPDASPRGARGTLAPMIRAYRLFTGDDGGSHVERGHVAPLGEDVAATSIHFKETAPGGSLDWHPAPQPQYVLTLTGTLEFATRDGETFAVAPGDVLLALDDSGSGHEWRMTGDAPWKRAYVEFPAGADLHFVRD